MLSAYPSSNCWKSLWQKMLFTDHRNDFAVLSVEIFLFCFVFYEGFDSILLFCWGKKWCAIGNIFLVMLTDWSYVLWWLFVFFITIASVCLTESSIVQWQSQALILIYVHFAKEKENKRASECCRCFSHKMFIWHCVSSRLRQMKDSYGQPL